MSPMVQVDERDWACECCVGGDDRQQYRRFHGSNSALPVYINHLSGHALLSSYTLKASIFYYQKIAMSDPCGLRGRRWFLIPKMTATRFMSFPAKPSKHFLHSKIWIADRNVLWSSVSVQRYYYPKFYIWRPMWLALPSPARATYLPKSNTKSQNPPKWLDTAVTSAGRWQLCYWSRCETLAAHPALGRQRIPI